MASKRLVNNVLVAIICFSYWNLTFADDASKQPLPHADISTLNTALETYEPLHDVLGKYEEAFDIGKKLGCTLSSTADPDANGVQKEFTAEHYQIKNYRLGFIHNPVIDLVAPSGEEYVIAIDPEDDSVDISTPDGKSIVEEFSPRQKCEVGALTRHVYLPDGRPLKDLGLYGDGIKELDINTPPKSLQEIYGATCDHPQNPAFQEILAAARDVNKITVAVIDIGVDYDDPEIAYKLDRNEPGLDLVENDFTPSELGGGPILIGTGGHGTAVSALAVAGSDKLALVAIRHNASDGPLDDLAAIDYAAKRGARVVNMSYGYVSDPDNKPIAPKDIEQVCDSIRQHSSILFVVATDDFGQNNDVNPMYPADCKAPNLISVGSVRSGLFGPSLSDFSGYGKTTVDIGAKGENVQLDLGYGGTKKESGTSFAAPKVTNVAAKMLVVNPNLTPEQIIAILESSSSKSSKLKDKFVSGGVLDEGAALELTKKTLNAQSGGDQ
jgi:subtilisin family serine protease